MYDITQNTETENLGTLVVPCDPYKFGRAVEAQQERSKLPSQCNVLFNKGRYFETTVWDKDIREEVANLTGLEVQYGNMFVGSWKQLEDFIVAMNCVGVYVKLEIDWI